MNLTGHKTKEKIFEDLVMGSVFPISKKNVPRGTFFFDIGTGAGIPGIPLAIFLPESNFLLMDSNHKKIEFVKNSAEALSLNNVKSLSDRLEIIGKDPALREKADVVLARGVGELGVVLELASSLVKVGGKIWIYSNKELSQINPFFEKRIDDLGLSYAGFDGSLLEFQKNDKIPEKFPRSFPAIKRDALKCK